MQTVAKISFIDLKYGMFGNGFSLGTAWMPVPGLLGNCLDASTWLREKYFFLQKNWDHQDFFIFCMQ